MVDMGGGCGAAGASIYLDIDVREEKEEERSVTVISEKERYFLQMETLVVKCEGFCIITDLDNTLQEKESNMEAKYRQHVHRGIDRIAIQS